MQTLFCYSDDNAMLANAIINSKLGGSAYVTVGGAVTGEDNAARVAVEAGFVLLKTALGEKYTRDDVIIGVRRLAQLGATHDHNTTW